MTALLCPYCGTPAKCVDSAVIYAGRSFGLAWVCGAYPRCDAYVKCHDGTDKPLGRLADKELRRAKIEAHEMFDALWKAKLSKRRRERGPEYKKKWARGSGYGWLARELGIPPDQCHIGMFDVELCRKVVAICRPYVEKLQSRRG